ncbi:MAG: VOC family protein [Akkermansiaceae bacterium]
MKIPATATIAASLLFAVSSTLQANHHGEHTPLDVRTATIDLGMVVSDLEKSLKFYTEACGFTPTGEFSVNEQVTKDSGLTEGTVLTIKKLSLGKGKGATTLKLMQPAKAPKKADQEYITSNLGFRYLTLHVHSMDAVQERLKKAGVPILSKGPVAIPGTKVFLTVVKDPDGNFVEFVGPKG